ncbi:hypothetical protein [Tenacibaculum maritimum]|uniref:hypothetical protein n=1 Tax=Tenacibaculum maritimum TaxID=107401 RepID=UPI00387722DF
MVKSTIKKITVAGALLLGMNSIQAQAPYLTWGYYGYDIKADYDNTSPNGEPLRFLKGNQTLGTFYRERLLFHKNIGLGISYPQEALHLLHRNIRIDGGAYQSNGRIQLRPDVDSTGDDMIEFKDSNNTNMATLQDGLLALGYSGTLQSYGDLTLRTNAGGSRDNNIYFRNQQDQEVAKLREGVLTLNMASTIETPGRLKLKPGASASNAADDVIAFLNSENSEMARVKDGTFTVKGGNTFQSYGDLNLRASVGNEGNGIIFFRNKANQEMARLEKGKLTLDQISLNVTTFPDYVFAKEYHLMPLDEVASYIKENKHLPNMPTEKEVVKEGMNVGQINTVLVEKVEELTLYIIQLKAQLDNQKKEIEKLKTSVKKD